MDILTLTDRVRDGAYRSDRFPAVPFMTLDMAMEHVQRAMTGPDAVVPEHEVGWHGVITPACGDRSRTETVTKHVGIGLRIGGEASLCFACGPDGGHYHPSEGETMDSVMATAARILNVETMDRD